MQSGWTWRTCLIVIWALALVLGLGAELERAQAIDQACLDACVGFCDGIGSTCADNSGSGCNCSWICENGTKGGVVCI